MTPANIPNLRLHMSLYDIQTSPASFELMSAVPANIDPYLLILT